MRTILNLFRRNWGLKLIALALALVIYYSMRDSKRNSRIPQNPLVSKGAIDGGNS